MNSLIADLDDALGAVGTDAGVGEDVVLRRPLGTGSAQQFIPVTVRARVSALTAEQISAGITQTDLNFVVSPSQINRANWPGGIMAQASQFVQDPRIPLAAKDQMICRGKVRTITFVDAVYVGNELVRINGRMMG